MPNLTKQTAFRLSDEDLSIIDALGQHYGAVVGGEVNRTQAIKTVIRDHVKRLKLVNPAEKPPKK